MDRESKMLLWVLGFGLSIVVVLAVFGIRNLDARTIACDQKEGIMVKTINGWRCIDSKVL